VGEGEGAVELASRCFTRSRLLIPGENADRVKGWTVHSELNWDEPDVFDVRVSIIGGFR